MDMQYTGYVMRMRTRDNNTALPLVGVLVTCFGRIKKLSIKSIKNENFYIEIIIGANLSF